MLLSSVSPFAGAFPGITLCECPRSLYFSGYPMTSSKCFVSELSALHNNENGFLKGAHGASLKFLIQVLVLHQDGNTFLPGWQLLSEKTIAVTKGDLLSAFSTGIMYHSVMFGSFRRKLWLILIYNDAYSATSLGPWLSWGL